MVAGTNAHLWWKWISGGMLLGACVAAPLQQPLTISNGNSIVLTAILFAGIGAILGACVCCRRRKYGFEPNNDKDRKEFENEAGTIETARSSEFPIFQALSLSPNIRNGSTIPSDPSTINPQPPVRHPHIQPLVIGDGRIVPVINQDINQIDNNNGPMSPADLQNIENNNASGYIQNQNEIDVSEQPILETEIYQRQADLFDQPLLQLHTDTFSMDFNIVHENASTHSSYLPQSQTITSSNNVNSSFTNDDIHSNDVPINLDEVSLLISKESAPAYPGFRSTQKQHMFNDLIQPNIQSKMSTQEMAYCYNEPVDEKWVCDKSQLNVDINPCASDTYSDEARGVEEALFALDEAIQGADDDELSDTDGEHNGCEDEIIKKLLPAQSVQLNNVICELLRNDLTRNNIIPKTIIETPNESKSDDHLIVDIVHEAKLMVDTIIEESIQRIHEKEQEVHKEDICPIKYDDTVSIFEINDTHVLKPETTETLNVTNDSLDEFDFKNLAIEASTPFVHKGFVPNFNMDSNEVPKIGKASQNLFGDDLQTHLENSWCLPITEDATFTTTNYNAEPDNATYVANEPFITKPMITEDIMAETMIIEPAISEPITTEKSLLKPKLASTNPPEIRIICEQETTSVDLTTATPVNTPIELNYSVDGWDTFVSNSMQKPVQTCLNELADTTYSQPNNCNVTVPVCDSTFALNASTSSDWFLHPQGTENNDGLTDDDDDEAEDVELLSLTFDSLRKQLTEALPHAQGAMSIGAQDFSDDIENNEVYMENQSTQPQAELFINYKRALSPIPEESEDESTCKTFVFNDTKCMDSTSTGNLEGETAEAMMGVNKTLMASNDTLFNFDDTLGDRDDQFSPRTTSTEPALPMAISQSVSNNSSIYECRTQSGPATIPLANRISPNLENVTIDTITGGTANPSDNTNATCIESAWEKPNDLSAAELLSPDLPKTFSEDTCIELAGGGTSSDMSLTFDGTYTTTFDDRTCILADAKLSQEEMETSAGADGDHSSVILDKPDNNSYTFFQPIDSIDVPIIHQTSSENIEHTCKLSGEEDPWILSTEDIRFTGPIAEMMTTSFSTSPKDWDSDAEEDSSEEFMYVKGVGPQHDSNAESTKNLPTPQTTLDETVIKENPILNLESTSFGDATISESEVWNAHADQVMVAKSPICNEDEHIGANSSSSEADEEWVPSCWDSMAQPARSALKSPDKTSSEEDSSGDSGHKKRRRVVFKKQNYHSVYEYPKEMVALSPAYSEPQMNAWDRTFDGRMPNYSGDGTVETGADEMDMFMVSSSARPFHNNGHSGSLKIGGSQFHAQCHTWPTSDSEFSWSQISDSANPKEQYNIPSYAEVQIKWPDNLKHFFCSDDATDVDMNNGDPNRPDSGVGESAELLTDSLGDLCHTKASLRLNLLSSPPQLSPQEQFNTINHSTDQSRIDEDNQSHVHFEIPDTSLVIMPTPSCTGSMDSLSSSSGSERQISFTTFGKTNTLPGRKISPDMFEGNTRNKAVPLNCTGSSLVFVDNDENESMKSSSPINVTTTMTTDKHELINSPGKGSVSLSASETSGKPQNDSTDEDSGIESIMRIKSSSPSNSSSMDAQYLKQPAPNMF